MSNEQRFGVVPSKAAGDENISDSECRTLLAIAIHSDRNGWCYPSQSKLAKIRGVSRQTINKHVAHLAELGYLNKQPRYKEDGGRTSDLIQVRLDFPPEADRGCQVQTLQGVSSPDFTGDVNPRVDSNITINNKEKQDHAPNGAPPPPPMQFTNGNHALNGHSGNSPRPPSSAAPPTPKKESSQHQQLMKAYQDCLGYKIRNGAADGKAAKQILDEGYTVQQVIDCYHYMKRDSFWQAKHLSLVSIHKQLGAFVQAKNGNGRTNGIEAEWQSIKIAVGQPGKPAISENALRAVQGVPGGWRRFKEQDARFMDHLRPLFEEAYERAVAAS